jgi:hypothetical protein
MQKGLAAIENFDALMCFSSLPILFSRTPNQSIAYLQGYEYHRLRTTAIDHNETNTLGHINTFNMVIHFWEIEYKLF